MQELTSSVTDEAVISFFKDEVAPFAKSHQSSVLFAPEQLIEPDAHGTEDFGRQFGDTLINATKNQSRKVWTTLNLILSIYLSRAIKQFNKPFSKLLGKKCYIIEKDEIQ